ncbi:hypothetical protein PHET_03772 [Paragonimus heterotremus]|uniref:Uncharacterized protein n=1 Tax=Paragonimus heterotremus TaxID=100268 RepID=A0A8J4X0W8_9TREM|nr:hypothetical protein PHET_03772 [Paragonimus heterotremus]
MGCRICFTYVFTVTLSPPQDLFRGLLWPSSSLRRRGIQQFLWLSLSTGCATFVLVWCSSS